MSPIFAQPLRVGQRYLPDWQDVKREFGQIFERRYFANNGPLVRSLDRSFASQIGVDHAVSVTNEMVGMMILAKAVAAAGEAIVPAYADAPAIEALKWAGFVPVIVDADPSNWPASAEMIRSAITPRTTLVVGVHLHGIPCSPEDLEAVARDAGLKLVFDAGDCVGAHHNGRSVGGFGDGEVFSFHERTIVNAGEGGCVTTRVDDTSKKLRTIRNFHSGETFASVPLRINGKMSEAQAALALLGLADLPRRITDNRTRLQAYAEFLPGTSSVALWRAAGYNEGNCSRAIVEIDDVTDSGRRDRIAAALLEQNVCCALPLEAAFVATAGQFPMADRLRSRLLELPNAAQMTVDDVERICEVVRRA